MLARKPREVVRAAARAYERGLEAARRKRLGQYFTGLPLGKLLAHLALESDTQCVLDPMAGHGDLLDASWEAAAERGIGLLRVDGIEIDDATAEICRERLSSLTGVASTVARWVRAGDAFDPKMISALPVPAYDLVITNPPYVRYQSLGGSGGPDDAVRGGLLAIVAERPVASDRSVWRVLARSYSGLSDLSVPAWILAAAMVRPGGRLALVVPATWRSRDYADIVRYLLLRCFDLECIVEDRQPGWFPDALVRTHLVVARRRESAADAFPPGLTGAAGGPPWVQVGPEAASEASLVGAACPGGCPEAEFATWLHAGCRGARRGIEVRRFDLGREWAELERRLHRRRWYCVLDSGTRQLPLFAGTRSASPIAVPEALAELLPSRLAPNTLVGLGEAGIAVGQGLRTGCNSFFYVTARATAGPGTIAVEASPLFGSCRLRVPETALRPALRRQSELALVEAGHAPDGRVLDLRSWVLPEDLGTVLEAGAAYAASGAVPPRPMPEELAEHVRKAAAALTPGGKLIPELSAVRTNVRAPAKGLVRPRFWYMLPDFVPRHFPEAFVPRVNHGLPRAGANVEPRLCVDANFSTLWALGEGWTRHALKALLNSVWCRAAMEALGTPMGGGALKLEATQLRQMPVPVLSGPERAGLHAIGREAAGASPGKLQLADEIVLGALCARTPGVPSPADLAKALEQRALDLASARRRSGR